ncbi:unnamed protein product [Linum tenue]|uniref:Uncharacterized protein n=1 Tax=Linum tenue TaxID=586396 RepID=A0AAV0QXT3_9ROSI|nr:unnamed protein product [Linum tenue]
MVHEGPSHLFRDHGVAPAGLMSSSVWSGAVHSVGGPRESKGVSPPRWSARYSRLAHEVGRDDRDMGQPTTSGHCHSSKCGSNGGIMTHTWIDIGKHR